jgi:hypothetical protein
MHRQHHVQVVLHRIVVTVVRTVTVVALVEAAQRIDDALELLLVLIGGGFLAFALGRYERTIVDGRYETGAGQVELGERLSDQPIVVLVLAGASFARHHRLFELLSALGDFGIDQWHGRVQRAQFTVECFQVGVHRRRRSRWFRVIAAFVGVFGVFFALVVEIFIFIAGLVLHIRFVVIARVRPRKRILR